MNSEKTDAADLNRDRSDEEERGQGNTRHNALDRPVERNVSLPRGRLHLSAVLSTHTHTVTQALTADTLYYSITCLPLAWADRQ